MSDSQELIHQDLAEEVAGGIPALHDIWRARGAVRPFMAIWPYEEVEFEGQVVNDRMPLDLPPQRHEWAAFIRQAVRTYKAWALMVVEQREQAVVVIFETPAGSRSWHLKIRRQGDSEFLEDPVVHDNVEYLGYLTRPGAQRASAEPTSAH